MLSRHFSFILKRDCTVYMWFQQTLQLMAGISDLQLYPSNLYLSNITKILSVIYFKTCWIWTLISNNRSNRKPTIRNNNIFVLNLTCNKWIPVTCSGSGRHIGYLYLHESCHVFRFWETYWIQGFHTKRKTKHGWKKKK